MQAHNDSTVQTPDATGSLKADLARFQEEVKKVVQLGFKSKTAAMRLLIDNFTALNEAGYSQDKLCEVLNSEGLEITRGTLKSLLSRVRQDAAKKSV